MVSFFKEVELDFVVVEILEGVDEDEVGGGLGWLIGRRKWW